MYSIVMTDGKFINIQATEVDYNEKTRMIRLFDGKQIVARINMDNVVGWVYAGNEIESEEDK